MILHRLHIMPYTIFLEIQVYVSVTLKHPLGPYVCMAEQLVTNLQVLQRLRLQEKVPASEHISDWGSEVRSKWLPRLPSRLYDVMGKNVKMSLVSWSVIWVLLCFRMMRRNGKIGGWNGRTKGIRSGETFLEDGFRISFRWIEWTSSLT